MQVKTLVIAIAAIATLSMPAVAAEGNPAGASPLAPDSSAMPKGTNNVDQLFIQLIGVGGHAEVEAGDMAARKGSADAVKNFGKRMTDDHKDSNKKLERIARGHDIDIGKRMDPDHERQRKYLGDLKGAEFDREYMRTQIAEHQRTALLLAWEVGSGQNNDLKEYAADSLPVVLEHLSVARDVLDQLLVPKR